VRRRFSIPLLVVLLAAAAALVAGLGREEARRRERAHSLLAELEGGPHEARHGPEAKVLIPLEAEGAAARGAQGRHAGVLEEDPETLVALCGRVVDEQSGLGVEGLQLSFLSRRPRTAVVTSGPDGAFRTECVLSCGVVTALHLPDDADPRFAARWAVEPAQFLLPLAGDAPLRRVDLHVRAPERVLEVQVDRPDGAAAASSSVALVWGERTREGVFAVLGRDFEVADGSGRAHFALPGDPPEGRLFELEAELAGREISDVLAFAAPLAPRPWRLDLYSGGTLRVRCTSDRGEPLAGVSLWLSSSDPLRAPRGRAGDTDVQGECAFTPLSSGCWTVRAVHPLTGESRLAECDLPRGAERTLALRLSLANLQQGASGCVLDEHDRPLEGVAIRVRNGNEAPVTIESRAGGRFEFWGQPSAGIELGAGPGFLDDDYLPARLELPFGTGGVVLRRAGHEEPLSYAVEIVSRTGGERLRAARLRLWSEEPLPAEESYSAESGVTQIQVPRTRRVRWSAEAPGYRRASGELEERVEARAGGVVRIALERGFERDLLVRDRVTRRELAGVQVWLGKQLLGRTDERGRVHLALEEWPGALRLECTGYELFEWDPLATAQAGDELRLEPLSPR
jgi:hypothetical protein